MYVSTKWNCPVVKYLKQNHSYLQYIYITCRTAGESVEKFTMLWQSWIPGRPDGLDVVVTLVQ